jgi:hypothetical protein
MPLWHPTRPLWRDEGYGDSQLYQGQQQPEGGGECRRCAEVHDGPPGAFAIGALGHTRRGVH